MPKTTSCPKKIKRFFLLPVLRISAVVKCCIAKLYGFPRNSIALRHICVYLIFFPSSFSCLVFTNNGIYINHKNSGIINHRTMHLCSDSILLLEDILHNIMFDSGVFVQIADKPRRGCNLLLHHYAVVDKQIYFV